MIAIYAEKGNNFSTYWVDYCSKHNLEFKLVNPYSCAILNELRGCKYFLWHINNFNYKDQIFAKELMYSIEASGIKVFPNRNTLWHFDDKIAETYLFKLLNIPTINTWIFYDKKEASAFITKTSYPKVFKLRKGSGSKGVVLVKTKKQAKRLVGKAFGKGFKTVSTYFMFRERYRKYKVGRESLKGLVKGFIRLFISTPYIRNANRERGYLYLQEFVPNNHYDTRVIVIGDRAFAIKRFNRKNDFRASGSGHIVYDKNQIDLNLVKFSFEVNKKLQMQCAALDFVYDKNNEPVVVEVSYGFNSLGYQDCEGYWDSDLKWYAGKIEPQLWMIENLIRGNE